METEYDYVKILVTDEPNQDTFVTDFSCIIRVRHRYLKDVTNKTIMLPIVYQQHHDITTAAYTVSHALGYSVGHWSESLVQKRHTDLDSDLDIRTFVIFWTFAMISVKLQVLMLQSKTLAWSIR